MTEHGPERAADGGERSARSVAEAVARTRQWFEVNSGWAPPDPETLEDWVAEGGSRCPDDCWVAPAERTCRHGLATWTVLLAVQAAEDAATRRVARRSSNG